MTHSDIEDALIELLIDNLPTINGIPISESLVQTPNAPFNIKDIEKDSTWIRTGVQWDNASQVSAGRNGYSITEGVLNVDIFSPPLKGNKTYKELQTQIIALIYKNTSIECTSIIGVHPTNKGIVGGWHHYKLEFSIRFTF
tara:strand:+ start:1233 stop:1655 length:423 start_codon:yes stop_codon:yes gene_type:complete